MRSVHVGVRGWTCSEFLPLRSCSNTHCVEAAAAAVELPRGLCSAKAAEVYGRFGGLSPPDLIPAPCRDGMHRHGDQVSFSFFSLLLLFSDGSKDVFGLLDKLGPVALLTKLKK